MSPPSQLGLDIGTGASCIYPLLAIRALANLRFIATELDEESYAAAELNVHANAAQDRVRLVKIDAQADHVLPEELRGKEAECVDFTMCNPPFYESHDEIAASLRRKELAPVAVRVPSITQSPAQVDDTC